MAICAKPVTKSYKQSIQKKVIKKKEKKVKKAVNDDYPLPTCRYHRKHPSFPGPLRKEKHYPCYPEDDEGNYTIANIKYGLLDEHSMVKYYMIEWSGWPWYAASWEPAEEIEGSELFEEVKRDIEYFEALNVQCVHKIGAYKWMLLNHNTDNEGGKSIGGGVWVPIAGFRDLYKIPRKSF